ncbi:MAG: 1-deoxy-D-xylulose-5-phosphate reductoisomerase [Cycloclasticus sp.]|nr:MAG: 1-deoxy-D-xylulose-5-phosphate reductoisomerase [Cycloclasticus sp.]
MKGLCLLGSSGSIGKSTLDVVRLNKETYSIVALTANKNIQCLLEQCIEFKPAYAVVPDNALADIFRKNIESSEASDTVVLSGIESLEFISQLDEVDIVVAAIVGAAGLLSTLVAAKAGKKLLLANKESLVISGDLLMSVVKENGATLLPLDSEHNALFQCMPDAYIAGQRPKGVRKLILTASGGPFLNTSSQQLESVTVEQACAHPNWSMGQKISVDSATMMNKGLEVIEASFLFDMPIEQIDVLVHPQSIIHSMVDYLDGSVIAQLGNPDMRTPIAHALAWPERHLSGVSALDFRKHQQLTFEPPSYERFPCLRLAYEALELKGSAPAVLNAANEVAVDAFLTKKIRFIDIPKLIEKVLENSMFNRAESIASILEADKEARALAGLQVERLQ